MVDRLGLFVFAVAAGFASIAALPQPAEAAARDAMQACATRVMGQLSKSGTPAERVGPTVVRQCDRQLRAALAEAIKTGEAGGCTVESCIAMAQERASEESTQQYQARTGR